MIDTIGHSPFEALSLVSATALFSMFFISIIRKDI